MGLKSRLGKYNGPVTCILCLRSHFKIVFKEPERRGLSAGSTEDNEQKAAATTAGDRQQKGQGKRLTEPRTVELPCTCCRAIELDSEGATSQTDRVVQL